MKLSEIHVGGRYAAKVSGHLVTVRVTQIKQIPPAAWSARLTQRTVIEAINEATGRPITIRSPQRLRVAIGNKE